MHKKIITLFMMVVLNECYSQIDRELMSFDYTLAPIGNDDIDLNKTSLKLSVPIKLKKGMLMNSIGFTNFRINYSNTSFETSELDQFYSINYGINYMYPISDKWKLSTRIGITMGSNLSGSITSEDLNFNGGLLGIRTFGEKKSPSVLIMGIGYATVLGKPRILPMISYRKIVNERFSYGIGFPSTFAKYQLNSRGSFKTDLAVSGFYANLSDSVLIDTGVASEKASLTSISLGLSYDYSLDKNWAINFRAGYSIYNNYELLDNNNDAVYEFDTASKPYFSTGIKFRINNNLKQKQYDK